jgi:hypothetical protein
MNSRSPKSLFSRATFIPWSSMAQEDEVSERGLHWGIRKMGRLVTGPAAGAPVKHTVMIKPKFDRKN